MAGNILQWVKANLLIVISSALIVILLPTGWFFSNGWNNSIQEKAADAFKKEKNRLSKASSIEYSLPAVLKGEEDILDPRPPNTIVTKFYAQQRALRQEQVAEVVARGTAFNKTNHTVPVQGLLPEANNLSDLRKKGFRLGEMIAGTEEAPSIYARLLRKLNAGDAPIIDVLSTSLNQYKTQQQEAYAATSPDGKMSVAQADQLDQDLIQRRLGEYAGQAESIAFYCPMSAIQTLDAESGYSHIPQSPPVYDSISESGVYIWVWDYWIISDLLRAVALANTDALGVSLAVPVAPIKHIEEFRIGEFVVQTTDDVPEDTAPRRRGGRGNPDPEPEELGPKTYTARGESSAYDIRYVDMTIVASSKDLPVLIDAIGKTNYMTIVDVDLSQVDVWDALDRGYYYGQDHVIRAHFTIETVWLRSWTKDLMPESIRTTLGVLLDSEIADDVDG